MTNESEIIRAATDLARTLSSSIVTVQAVQQYSTRYESDTIYMEAMNRHAAEMAAYQACIDGVVSVTLKHPPVGSDEHFLMCGEAKAKLHVIKDEDYRALMILLRNLKQAVSPLDGAFIAGERTPARPFKIPLLDSEPDMNKKKRRRRNRAE